MPRSLQYVVDEKGRKVSVIVPLKVWEALNTKHQKLQRKITILCSIQNGLKEVKPARRSGRKLQSLHNFLK